MPTNDNNVTPLDHLEEEPDALAGIDDGATETPEDELNEMSEAGISSEPLYDENGNQLISEEDAEKGIEIITGGDKGFIVTDLSDQQLLDCVDEVVRRSMKMFRERLWGDRPGGTLQIAIETSVDSGATLEDFKPIKHKFKMYCYNHPQVDCETYSLFKSATLCADRINENKAYEPRKMLAAN